jgi:hypothetical protein
MGQKRVISDNSLMPSFQRQLQNDFACYTAILFRSIVPKIEKNRF